MRQCLVIGSGPAGVAAAWALRSAGVETTLVDAGLQLEAGPAALKSRLAEAEPQGWAPQDVALHRGRRRTEKSDQMQPYGSDFLFRDPLGVGSETTWPLDQRPSFAQGGLSNGWGAAILPYRAGDIADWPVGLNELEPHYQALREFVPLSARIDALQDFFPAFSVSGADPLPLSGQGAELLRRLHAKAEPLRQDGVVAGAARQAVAASDCRSCGACLYGCPYGLVFNASAPLQVLRSQGLVYLDGQVVERIEETGEGVLAHCRSLSDGARSTLQAQRLVIAAGVLSTARLVLASGAERDRILTLRDSHHFYLPMLQTWRSRPDPRRESKHTLTEAFLEIDDARVSPRTVHAQVYSYNDLYAPDMRQRFGPFAPLSGPLVGQLARRLLVSQAFLHSDHSAAIELRLADQTDGRLDAKILANPQQAKVQAAAAATLTRIARAAGLVALGPLLRSGTPGSSFHSGSTLPMRAAPGPYETDPNGKLFGSRGVYIADASVFPTIPATTITLSVMANAHRIGAGVAQDLAGARRA